MGLVHFLFLNLNFRTTNAGRPIKVFNDVDYLPSFLQDTKHNLLE